MPQFSQARLLLLMLLLCLGACATQPEVRTQSNPAADFSSFRSFAFYSPLGTDKSSGYNSILSQYLKTAAREALEARGYRYDEQKPDLLVNFGFLVQDRTNTVSMPSTTYYRTRSGRYVPWTTYDDMVFQYRESTLNIDLVDARQKQVVWEGLAATRLGDVSNANLEREAHESVTEIFAHYPYRAGAR